MWPFSRRKVADQVHDAVAYAVASALEAREKAPDAGAIAVLRAEIAQARAETAEIVARARAAEACAERAEREVRSCRGHVDKRLALIEDRLDEFEDDEDDDEDEDEDEPEDAAPPKQDDDPYARLMRR